MKKNTNDIEQMVIDALCSGDLARLQSQCPDGDISLITPVAEQVIQDQISEGRDMDADLSHFAQTVKGDAKLEQAFNAAVKTSIPDLLKKGNFIRLTYVLQACAGNPVLWEPAINNESFREFVRKWTKENNYDSLARLKAVCARLSIDPASFGFDTKTGYHLYNIGAEAKDDLIITTGDHDGSGHAQIICHTNGFNGSPSDLIKHWCAADQERQQERKIGLSYKITALEIITQILHKDSRIKQAVERRKLEDAQKIRDNPLLGGAQNKTLFLLAALSGLKDQNPHLTTAYHQALDDIDQMIPS